WRATRDFFVLPRLGFDGWYTTLRTPPQSTNKIDDDVYNVFRFTHNSLAFAQLLLWWVPRFNDIFYLRGRVTADAAALEFNHAALRSGIFLAFGDLDSGAFFDAARYTSTASAPSETEFVTGVDINYNAWVVPGSFDVQPGVTGRYRFDTQGAEVFLVVNLLSS